MKSRTNVDGKNVVDGLIERSATRAHIPIAENYRHWKLIGADLSPVII